MKPFLLAIIAVVGASILTGCATNPASTSPLNQARVSTFLKKGETTQAQVIEKLGPPNIVTTDSNDREVWTYQKHSISGGSVDASVTANEYIYGGSGFFGPGSVFASLGGSSYEESSKTMTLSIKFNRHNIVEEYKSISSSF